MRGTGGTNSGASPALSLSPSLLSSMPDRSACAGGSGSVGGSGGARATSTYSRNVSEAEFGGGDGARARSSAAWAQQLLLRARDEAEAAIAQLGARLRTHALVPRLQLRNLLDTRGADGEPPRDGLSARRTTQRGARFKAGEMPSSGELTHDADRDKIKTLLIAPACLVVRDKISRSRRHLARSHVGHARADRDKIKTQAACERDVRTRFVQYAVLSEQRRFRALTGSLRAFTLDAKQLDAKYVALLAETLLADEAASLHTLSLQANLLCAKGVTELVHSIVLDGAYGALAELDLSANNSMGPDGVAVLAEAFSYGAFRLRSLALRACDLDVDDGLALARALPSSWSLTALDLRDNFLTDAAVGALLKASQLQHKRHGASAILTIEGNPISAGMFQLVALSHLAEAGVLERTHPDTPMTSRKASYLDLGPTGALARGGGADGEHSKLGQGHSGARDDEQRDGGGSDERSANSPRACSPRPASTARRARGRAAPRRCPTTPTARRPMPSGLVRKQMMRSPPAATAETSEPDSCR
jgi:hypothetical protein